MGSYSPRLLGFSGRLLLGSLGPRLFQLKGSLAPRLQGGRHGTREGGSVRIFDGVESEFEVENTQFLRLDPKTYEKRHLKKLMLIRS